MKGVLIALMVLLLGQGVLAAGFDLGACYTTTKTEDSGLTQDVVVRQACSQSHNELRYVSLNMTLGNVSPGEVEMGQNYIYVDSALRPDLDVGARLVFYNLSFAVEPEIYKDGVECTNVECQNRSFSFAQRKYQFDVTGFSNYSLQAKQEFTVLSDPEPELKSKTYQVVDLGSAHRASPYACVVMIFAPNDRGELVLVQTNPERKVQGKLFGDVDVQQPESLGYFPTQNGIANVYFRGDEVAAYSSFNYVVQCSSNSTMLIYEEVIDTRYSEVGRKPVGWMIWFTADSNAGWIIFGLVALVILLLLIAKFVRTVK